MYIYIYIYIYTHVYIHIYIYTYIHKYTTHCAVDAGQQFSVELHHGVDGSLHLLLGHRLQLTCSREHSGVTWAPTVELQNHGGLQPPTAGREEEEEERKHTKRKGGRRWHGKSKRRINEGAAHLERDAVGKEMRGNRYRGVEIRKR